MDGLITPQVNYATAIPLLDQNTEEALKNKGLWGFT